MSNRWETSTKPSELLRCIHGEWRTPLFQRKLRLCVIPTVRYTYPSSNNIQGMCDLLTTALDDVDLMQVITEDNLTRIQSSFRVAVMDGDSEDVSSHLRRGRREALVYTLGCNPVVVDSIVFAFNWMIKTDVAGKYCLDEAAGITKIVTQMACNHIRDVFGPYQWRHHFSPTWRTETVIALVRGILADKAFDRMPILADALQDADCDDADILTHCRGEGSHVLGCWVLDAIMDKHPPLSWRA